MGQSSRSSELVVAPCSLAAARLAVTRWHYSQRMPAGKLALYGVWESGDFIGSVMYGLGANSDLGAPYGLRQGQICELVRVALRGHVAPVSQIVAESLRLLHAANPGLRLVVSFADPEQDHHGGIYQAGNWIYCGKSGAADEYIVHGKRYHGRSLRAARNSHPRGPGPYANVLDWARVVMKDPAAQKITGSSKHRYLMPLDKQMRRRVAKLAMPYPQPRGRGVEGDAPDIRSGGAGSTPADRSTIDREGVA